MNVSVSGHQMDLGDSLREAADNRIKLIEATYQIGMTNSEVIFERGEKSGFLCRIHSHFRGGNINVVAEGRDAYSALSRAAIKANKRARRISRAKNNYNRDTIRTHDAGENQNQLSPS